VPSRKLLKNQAVLDLEKSGTGFGLPGTLLNDEGVAVTTPSFIICWRKSCEKDGTLDKTSIGECQNSSFKFMAEK
jgi:hypothetical protein